MADKLMCFYLLLLYAQVLSTMFLTLIPFKVLLVDSFYSLNYLNMQEKTY